MATASSPRRSENLFNSLFIHHLLSIIFRLLSHERSCFGVARWALKIYGNKYFIGIGERAAVRDNHGTEWNVELLSVCKFCLIVSVPDELCTSEQRFTRIDCVESQNTFQQYLAELNSPQHKHSSERAINFFARKLNINDRLVSTWFADFQGISHS